MQGSMLLVLADYAEADSISCSLLSRRVRAVPHLSVCVLSEVTVSVGGDQLDAGLVVGTAVVRRSDWRAQLKSLCSRLKWRQQCRRLR